MGEDYAGICVREIKRALDIAIVFGCFFSHLSKLHLIHALSSVPMQESLATEHSSELLTDALKELLDGRAVTNESGSHLQTTRWDVANGGLHVVGDPFHKVAAILVLDVEHLLIDLLH